MDAVYRESVDGLDSQEQLDTTVLRLQ